MGSDSELIASFCVSSDSEVGLGKIIANHFSSAGVKCKFYVVQHKKEHILNDRQLEKLTGYPTKLTTAPRLFSPTGKNLKDFESDFIFLLLSGPAIFDCIRRLKDTYNLLLNSKTVVKRPVLVSGIPGLEIANVAGPYLYRSSADVHFLNSTNSLHSYKKCVSRANKSFYVNLENAHVTGLPVWDLHFENKKTSRPKSKLKKILFAGQNAFPDNLYDRAYLIRKFIEYCELNPDVKVLYKPRNEFGVKSPHPVIWHEEAIIKGLRKKSPIPKNFILTYKSISTLLDDIDLCLSISSTVLAEAIIRNIPSGVIKDPRLNKPNYGYWFFENSGLFTNFKKLREHDLPVLSKAWKEANIKADGKNCEDLLNACMRVWHVQKSSGTMLPFRMHDFHQAHVYYEGLKKKFKKKNL